MPPIYKVVLSRQAEQDLLNIYDAICEIATPYNAERTTFNILNRAGSLSLFSTRGQIIPDKPDIRTIKAGNYRIFFTINYANKTVSIIRFSTKGCDFKRLISGSK